MALDQVKEWLYGCTHCGTCKDVLNIFAPACPSGEMYQLESYFPSGRMLIARGVSNGVLDLSDEEITYIEMKLGLARALKLHRTAKLKMSQHALAELIGSSQSRVAKMEAGDPSVTLDLLVRSMLSTGFKRAEIARAVGRTDPA